MRRQHGRTRDRGAAAVEFALVLPVLLILVFGIIDFGRMLNAQITLTEAAREGARATALLSAAEGTSRANQAASGLGSVDVEVTQDCPANPGLDDEAVLQVNYDFSFVTPIGSLTGLFGGGGDYGDKTLTAKGVMPCLR